MPHIIITPSCERPDVSWDALLRGVADCIVSMDEKAQPAACKGRVYPPLASSVGTTHDPYDVPFYAVEIKLLPGRDLSRRQAIAEGVLSYLTAQLGPGVTVEITEMMVYCK
ncbi:hypothetical protein EBZ35_07475 [bacterium]|nr:hypothetical protein [bacterium]